MVDFHTTRDTYIFPPWLDDDINASEVLDGTTTSFPFSNAAVNSPVAYAPAIIGYWVGSLVSHNAYFIIITMRLFQVAFLGVVLFFCIRLVPVGKWPMAVFGAIPNLIFVNASVSADVVTTATCVVLFVAFLRLLLVDTHERVSWTVLAVSAVIIGLAKLSYLPLVGLLALLLLFVPELRTRRTVFAVAGIIVASVACFALWYVHISGINTGALYSAEIDPDAQLDFVLANPGYYLSIMLLCFDHANLFQVSMLGSVEAHGYVGPESLLIIRFIVAMLIRDDREVRVTLSFPRSLALFLCIQLLCLMVFALIALALYLQFNLVANDEIEGVQARYFLPLLPMVLLSLQLLMSQLLTEGGKLQLPEQPVAASWLITACMALSAVLTIVRFCALLFGG